MDLTYPEQQRVLSVEEVDDIIELKLLQKDWFASGITGSEPLTLTYLISQEAKGTEYHLSNYKEHKDLEGVVVW